MQYLELDIAQFRERFPEFADPVKYPDELIESLGEEARTYTETMLIALEQQRIEQIANDEKDKRRGKAKRRKRHR